MPTLHGMTANIYGSAHLCRFLWLYLNMFTLRADDWFAFSFNRYTKLIGDPGYSSFISLGYFSLINLMEKL